MPEAAVIEFPQDGRPSDISPEEWQARCEVGSRVSTLRAVRLDRLEQHASFIARAGHQRSFPAQSVWHVFRGNYRLIADQG